MEDVQIPGTRKRFAYSKQSLVAEQSIFGYILGKELVDKLHPFLKIQRCMGRLSNVFALVLVYTPLF